MSERIKITLPIIVEGRYDKSTLLSVFDATVITTGGFAVFNSKEKQALIRKLAERGGIILLTDSDGGGRQIRSFLSGVLPKESIHHLYIPEVAGKEKRKSSPSKAGLLGVEGMKREMLEKLLRPFYDNAASEGVGEKPEITKRDFYVMGLSGGEYSSQKRDLLARRLGLPAGMSANALIEAVNLICDKEEYDAACKELFPD